MKQAFKYELEHPESGTKCLDALLEESCPEKFGLMDDPDTCCNDDYPCSKCWDREIPETPTKEKSINEQRAEQGLEPVLDQQYIQIGTILDSGDRTQFESGAVRDMREGKGRCDLMPLEVAAEYLAMTYPSDVYNKNILKGIADFQKTGGTHHLYTAIGRFATDAYGSNKRCDPTMLLEVAKHFEEGAKKYGENNWQKGIPVHCYIDSAVRHYLKWLRGDKDEPHDRAFVWNLMCCIWEVDCRPKDTHEFLKEEDDK
jgi:hypothetical protein